MRSCKITVIKRNFEKELAEEYGAIGIGPCSFLKDGQTFVISDTKKPEGFCDEAWSAIHQYVFALAHNNGERLFFRDSWIRKPNVAICSCNDGLRPVIFKIEAMEG